MRARVWPTITAGSRAICLTDCGAGWADPDIWGQDALDMDGWPLPCLSLLRDRYTGRETNALCRAAAEGSK